MDSVMLDVIGQWGSTQSNIDALAAANEQRMEQMKSFLSSHPEVDLKAKGTKNEIVKTLRVSLGLEDAWQEQDKLRNKEKSGEELENFIKIRDKIRQRVNRLLNKLILELTGVNMGEDESVLVPTVDTSVVTAVVEAVINTQVITVADVNVIGGSIHTASATPASSDEQVAVTPAAVVALTASLPIVVEPVVQGAALGTVKKRSYNLVKDVRKHKKSKSGGSFESYDLPAADFTELGDDLRAWVPDLRVKRFQCGVKGASIYVEFE